MDGFLFFRDRARVWAYFSLIEWIFFVLILPFVSDFVLFLAAQRLIWIVMPVFQPMSATTKAPKPSTTMSPSELKEWLSAFDDCKALAKYLMNTCKSGPYDCSRGLTKDEEVAICREFTNLSGKCRTHDITNRWMTRQTLPCAKGKSS